MKNDPEGGELTEKDVVKDTIESIEGVLDYEEHARARQLNHPAFNGVRRSTFWSQQKPVFYVYFALEFLALIALIVWTVTLARKGNNRIDACVEALEMSGCSGASCDPPLVIRQYITTPERACEMSIKDNLWWGAPKWRWTMFLALLPALDIVLWGALLMLLDVSHYSVPRIYVQFYGLHDEMAHFLRQALWLGLWLWIMDEPLKWSNAATLWNEAASSQVKKQNDIQEWNEQLQKVHSHVWRVLSVLVILFGLLLFREAVVQVLSMQFHRKGRFGQLTRAIVYESAIEKIIQAFLKHQPEAQNDALLEAFECLGNMQALNETERETIENLQKRIRKKSKQLQDKARNGEQLAKLPPHVQEEVEVEQEEDLAVSVAMAPCSSVVGAMPGFARVQVKINPVQLRIDPQQSMKTRIAPGHTIADDPDSLLLNALKRRVRKEEIVKEAKKAHTDLRKNLNGSLWLHIVRVCSCSTYAGCGMKGLEMSRQDPQKILGELLASHLRDHPFLRDLDNEDIDSRMQARHLGFYLFWFLKGYFKKHPETLGGTPMSRATSPSSPGTPRKHAGRVPNSAGTKGFAIHQEGPDVVSASQSSLPSQPKTPRTAGVCYLERNDTALERLVGADQVNSAWDMITGVSEQGGDLFALTRTGHVLDSSPKRHPDSSYATEYQSTIEEAAQTELARARACVRKINLFGVIKAVERVYDRRKALSLTQQESKAVVQQVGGTMGWMFLLAIAFIAPAFWLPDEIKEIVLALSAVLVSVTFIFGNTLGELFDNAAFLLFSHPFDVEDEIVLEGTPYIVDYIALPYINLLRKSDDAFIRVTTQQLRHHRIHNVSRSKVKAPGIVLTEQGRSPGGKGSKFSPSSHGSPGNKVLESQLTAVQAVGQATIM